MIHVVATIEVKAGKRDEFLTAFRALVPLVHAERGCLEYGPTIDLATGIDHQPPPRDNVVTVVEKWDSPEALKDHLAAPHMQRYREQVGAIVVGVEIRVLQPTT
jgi:quinol monooxygenase YgiN